MILEWFGKSLKCLQFGMFYVTWSEVNWKLWLRFIDWFFEFPFSWVISFRTFCFQSSSAFKIISGNIQVICITWSAPDLYLHPLPDMNPRVTRQDLNPTYQSWVYISAPEIDWLYLHGLWGEDAPVSDRVWSFFRGEEDFIIPLGQSVDKGAGQGLGRSRGSGIDAPLLNVFNQHHVTPVENLYQEVEPPFTPSLVWSVTLTNAFLPNYFRRFRGIN